MTGPRSFTVRVPYEVYLTICDLAQAESKKINTKVNELLNLGIGKAINLNGVLASMLATKIDQENGK